MQPSADARQFLRRAALFLLVGLALYGIAYAASEYLVYKYAHRNRFYVIKTAPAVRYDYVILGASHAVVFDFADMNVRLERMTGAKILNLAVVGGKPLGQGEVQDASQKITREEALRMMTYNNAYMMWREHKAGSIEPGKLADFLVLSADYMTVPEDQIRDILPVATYVGGKQVFAGRGGTF